MVYKKKFKNQCFTRVGKNICEQLIHIMNLYILKTVLIFIL